MELYNHEVIGHEVVYQNGCFQREKYWFRGWHKDIPGQIQFVNGWSGRETVLTVETIRPSVIFHVRETEVLDPEAR